MECYICYDKETKSNKFCSYDPCKCSGTNKIHVKCLEEVKSKCGNVCSICKSNFKDLNGSKKCNVIQNHSSRITEMIGINPVIISRSLLENRERDLERTREQDLERTRERERERDLERTRERERDLERTRERETRNVIVKDLYEDDKELYNYVLQITALEDFYEKSKQEKKVEPFINRFSDKNKKNHCTIS